MATKKGKQQVILDSNVWIGYFVDDDSLHTASVKVMDDLDDKVVIIPEYVLIEVVTLLKCRKYYDIAKEFAINTLGNNSIYLPAPNIARLVTEQCFKKENKKLSFVDTSLLVLSKDYEIITFDKDLQKAIKTNK